MSFAPGQLLALNNDHSHTVFIYVLKRGVCSHFPALSPCTDDKVGKASARWRRGVIYNHINFFTFSAGLGHCHFCPRGESHNPISKQHPINIWDDEAYPYLQSRYGNSPAAYLGDPRPLALCSG